MIIYDETFDAEATLKAVSEEKQPPWGAYVFFAELDHPDLKQYDLNGLNRNYGRIALSFRTDEESANRNAFSRNGNWLRHDRNSPLSTQTRHDAPFDKRVKHGG
jgi:hypothetical protein